MAEPVKRRYSEYNVTINTNHKTLTAEAEHVLKQRMKTFFETELAKPNVLGDMFVFSPNISIVEHVKVTAGVELGPKTGFVHGHAVLLIEHHGKVSLKKQGAQAALQRHVIASVGTRGAYSNIQLANAQLLNYVVKTSGEAEEIESTGIREPISF